MTSEAAITFAAKLAWKLVRPILCRAGTEYRRKVAADLRAGRVLSAEEYQDLKEDGRA